MGAEALPAIAIGAQAASTYVGVKAGEAKTDSEVKYYKYLSSLSKQNADIAEAQGKAESEQIGAASAMEMGQLEQRKREAIGSQKAALAAGGAGVGSKTAEQIVSDTINKTDMDEQVLRYNTDLRLKNTLLKSEGEAFNYRAQGRGYDLSEKNARIAGAWNKRATILGGAASMTTSAAQMKWS